MPDTPAHLDAPWRESRLPRHMLLMSICALAGVILAVVAIVLFGLSLWSVPAGGPSAGLNGRPPGLHPALETAPQMDRAQFVQSEQRRLSSFGWVDRSRGVAHIPLEEALQLAAQGQLTLPGGPANTEGGTPVAGERP